jgi:hypothetical protein
MTRVRRTTAALAVLVGALALPAPARAATLALDDPSGDASTSELDFTRVKVSNGDKRVLAVATFVADVSGDVIISIDPRRHRGVRLVSEYRPGGTTRNYVVRGAFTDLARQQAAARAGNAVDCPGYRVRWNTDTNRVRLRLPSRCLHHGDYGAVRFAFLSEQGTTDSDWGPESGAGQVGSSGWVARG